MGQQLPHIDHHHTNMQKKHKKLKLLFHRAWFMSGSIKAIDNASVTKICSGQVVVDLATAVKELVENALDAEATTIEIKLRDMGLTSIEVSDNGRGIHPSNYASLALKHHTSKLTTFADLQSVSSFGFRGEALNALCELSNDLTITTRRPDETVGTKLSFSPQQGGALTSQTVCPRSEGTTVLVQELFSRLPVRRSEFQRSIKRQYQKLVRVLQGYAIIAIGVRLIVINSERDGGAPGSNRSKVSTVIGTQGSTLMSDNIASVFGSKFLQTLVKVECKADLPLSQEQLDAEEAEAAGEWGAHLLSQNGLNESLHNPDTIFDDTTHSKKPRENVAVVRQQVHVRGFVSKVGAGVGRSDNDRQFVYCNGRPVDLPKFTKVVNEVWRKYEMKHKSACILDVRVPAGWFDVNLAPDKREVIIAGEEVILEALRTQMDSIFAPTQSTFHLSQGNQPNSAALGLSMGGTGTERQVSLLETYNHAAPPSTFYIQPSPLSPTITDAVVTTSSSTSKFSEPVWLSAVEETILQSSQEQRKRDRSVSMSPVKVKESSVPSQFETQQIQSNYVKETNLNENTTDDVTNMDFGFLGESVPQLEMESANDSPRQVPLQVPIPRLVKTSVWAFDAAYALGEDARNSVEPQPAYKKSRTESVQSSSDASLDSVTTEAGSSLTSPDAERTLARVLHKDDFAHMRIVGQFNLGFIICELRGDLFILDQHACDEKFLFETLQLRTEVHRQPLIAPMTLQCSAAEEMLIIEHMHVFERNGFRFAALPDDVFYEEKGDKEDNTEEQQIKSSVARAGSRLQLIAVPFSKGTQFNHTDVHELASLLAQDSRLGEDYYLGGSENAAGSGGTGGVDVSKLMHKNTPLQRESKNSASQLSQSSQALLSLPIASDSINAATKNQNGDNIYKQAAGVAGAASPNIADTLVLPKLMQMFASRACRTAVMIGTALTTPQMKKIVKQMQSVIHPWQCPHGRPTMRHLTDLMTLCKES